jgi:hypothetical protein
MRRRSFEGRTGALRRLGLALAAAALAGAAVTAAALGGGKTAAISPPPSPNCHLGNGIQHVIELTFDNTHFNRDNPNVLSDLEQMPHLLNFFTQNGTLLSNNYTPLIAHTADDSLTNYTGLYGDRHGQGITNSYETYVNGTPTSKSSFAYWTGTYGLDAYPNMPYSPVVPAANSPQTPPAPWVPFTRAGCDVGDVSTANMVLENTNPDLQNIFGPNSPEVAQYNADTDSFKDQETNDYVGVGVHCAQSDSFCSTAMAVKFGQSTPSNTAVDDKLPDEPGGYTGFQALFGHRYLTPQLAQAATVGGNRVVNGDTYPVTDGSGNLTDLNGQTMKGQFAVPGHGFTPGFPGFGPISAAQTLAYIADMQETGVPVTYGYISDVHEKKTAGGNTQTGCTNPSTASAAAQGPGDPCDEQNLQQYDMAFQKFFQRLADDGINPSNTLFVLTADEGDHFAGANLTRAVQPACGAAPVSWMAGTTCSYATVSGTPRIGEQQVSIHGLLANQEGNTTPFYNESQGNSIYINGQPGPNDQATRQMEHDFFSATANDVFDGNVQENITQYEMDQKAEALLHFVNADPARTPTFTLFPKPDFFFTIGATDGSPANQCASGVNQSNAWQKCSQTNQGFAWDHGYYAPEIDNTYVAFVGPGVAHKGVDGLDAAQGPNSDDGANSNPQLVTSIANPGTWADHTDTRPTMLALTGLKDDYTDDGRVLTEDLTVTPGQTGDSRFQPLASCYKQLDSSVGRFGTDVIVADTAALRTGSASDDSAYQLFSSQLKALGAQRDALATKIKNDLFNAEFNNTPIPHGNSDLAHCNTVLNSADKLTQVATGAAPTIHGTGGSSATCSNAGFTGTTDNLSVPAGAFCIAEGTVTQDVTVGSGGQLISFTGLSVGRDLNAGQNAQLVLFGGSVGRNLNVSKPSLDILGFGGALNVAHDLAISGSNAPNGIFVDVCAAKVLHDLTVTGTSNSSEIEVGDDEFCDPSAGGSSAGHDLVVTGNGAFFLDVGNNSAAHDLTVKNNTAQAGGYVDVSDNSVSHDASCSGNSPALSKDGADDHANNAAHNNTCG